MSTRRFRRRARGLTAVGDGAARIVTIGVLAIGVVAIGVVAIGAPATDAAPAPVVAATRPPVDCRVVEEVTWDSGDAFGLQLTVTNTGRRGADGWRVETRLPAGVAVLGTWGAALRSQDAGVLVLTNEFWNGRLAPGKSLRLGFNATGRRPETGAVTSGLTWNGAACAGSVRTAAALQVGSVRVPSERWEPFTRSTAVAPGRPCGDADAAVTARNRREPVAMALDFHVPEVIPGARYRLSGTACPLSGRAPLFGSVVFRDAGGRDIDVVPFTPQPTAGGTAPFVVELTLHPAAASVRIVLGRDTTGALAFGGGRLELLAAPPTR